MPPRGRLSSRARSRRGWFSRWPVAVHRWPGKPSGTGRPDFLARLLLGNGGEALRQVRDPFVLGDTLSQAGLRYPRVSRLPPATAAEAWLRKRFRSSGGQGIEFWDSAARPGQDFPEPAPEADAGWFFQQFIPGQACSAVFLGSPAGARLVGLTRQLVGVEWTGAPRFGYCGSIGPLELDAPTTKVFQRLGDVLSSAFGLLGLFGVDAVLGDGEVWTIEVNPRYTASVEVLERAWDLPLLDLHAAGCRSGHLPPEIQRPTTRVCGKAVLYASARCSGAGRLRRVCPAAWRHRPVPRFGGHSAGGSVPAPANPC